MHILQAGKMAATAIGGTLLLLQIAHHKGYIKVEILAGVWFQNCHFANTVPPN